MPHPVVTLSQGAGRASDRQHAPLRGDLEPVGRPASARVNNLEIDPTDARVAYAAIATTSGTSVYRTTDGGVTWSPRAAGLPSFAAQGVRVDPTDRNVLYCGVDVGVYRSTDQGASWEKFGSGLPSSSVQDIRITDDGSMLRVATHGRGVWELDVPPTGNTPPFAAISSPSDPLTFRPRASRNIPTCPFESH